MNTENVLAAYRAADAQRPKQLVTIGRSASGKWGLFTGGFMAWPMQFEDVLFYHGNDEKLAAYCAQRGFEFTGWSSQP